MLNRRKNTSDQIVIAFKVTSDCLGGFCEFSRPVTEWSNTKPMQFFFFFYISFFLGEHFFLKGGEGGGGGVKRYDGGILIKKSLREMKQEWKRKLSVISRWGFVK